MLVLTLVTMTAACSGSGGGATEQRPPAAGPTPSPAALAEPPVTLAEARKELAGVLGAQEVLSRAMPRQDADVRNMRQQSRDGQEALTTVALNDPTSALPHYTWGSPQVLVPRTQRGPLWFAAIVNRRDEAGDTRTAVLILIKYGEERWSLSSTSLLEPGERAPEIAKDPQGYATALSSEDRTIAISPRLMAPLHATSAEEGGRGFTAGLVAKGPHTTGYADEIAAKRMDYRHDQCMDYDSIFAAGSYPIHALRTVDGGAMVTYSLIRTTTVTTAIEPCATEIRVPAKNRKLAGASSARKQLRTVETQLYVSTVPARDSHRPARVIGYLGGITKLFVS
ncbi:hypothetical protein FHR32_004244 [Streptosporangium album]|uniref:DUF8094 domain-containing protein n=1 Tax=Streptosporangium album TaxID=47479 RepID=A0A7W7RX80_9ACTN|nr:hypothetical protein [Streptosporangium album]MBB4939939.1 hypothetical protein [Streptosporangium album]